MSFTVGTHVKFLYSADEGVITAILGNGMVQVLLTKEQMEIPAFLEDLLLKENISKPAAPVVLRPEKRPAPKHVAPVPLVPPPAPVQYAILKSYGIQLAFLPRLNGEGTAESYEIYLINDTRHDVVISFTLLIRGQIEIQWHDKLPHMSTFHAGRMAFDDLNESPEAEMDCWRLTTAGPEDKMSKTVKIKAKSFFNNLSTAPLLNQTVHLYRVFEKLVQEDADQPKEDLKSYAQRNAKPVARQRSNSNNAEHPVAALAHFEPEIDLHVEKLTDKAAKMTNSEILSLQLSHFERYMDDAIRLGQERVFVIHGVGQGRLRNSIASRLIQYTEVKSFKNEYHPRYGFGATEVIFYGLNESRDNA